MNLQKNRIYLFGLLLLMTFGCRSCDTVESSEIAQSEIYQDYSVEALKSGAKATAFFRVGGSTGTTIDLVPPSKIELNGTEMTKHPRTFLNGTDYTLASDTAAGRYLFSYTNGDGQVFQNEIDFEPIELVSVPATIDPKQKTIISLSRPVRDDESLDTSIVSLETPPQNANAPANNSNTAPSYLIDLHQNTASGRTAIEIAPGAIKNLAPGKAEISIRVSAGRDLEQKTRAGGGISYRYSSAAYGTNIIK